MLNLNEVYLLKAGFGSRDIYIGANVVKVQSEYGRTVIYIFVLLILVMHVSILTVRENFQLKQD